MVDSSNLKPIETVPSVELVDRPLNTADLNDLCDSTDAAIEAGGGFGWIKLPSREILERYWQGVITMPSRLLFVARLDNVICGSAQLILPPANNEAQAHSVTLTALFISPWARGHGLARNLLDKIEATAKESGYSVINLDVRETQDAAISLYESAGYEQIGRHPYYAKVGGTFVSGRYYCKVLG